MNGICTRSSRAIIFCLTAFICLFLAAQASAQSPSPAEDFVCLTMDDHVEIHGYLGKDTTVVVPEEINGLPVTYVQLGKSEYDDVPEFFPYVRKVVLPRTVVTLGSYCFGEYSLLDTIEGLEYVQELEGNVFDRCGVKEWVFSSTLKKVDLYSFSGSFMGVERLVLPDDLDFGSFFFTLPYNLQELRLIRGEREATMKLQDQVIYSPDGKALLRLLPYCKAELLAIPEGVETADLSDINLLYTYAFQFPRSLRSFSSSYFSDQFIYYVYDGSWAQSHLAEYAQQNGIDLTIRVIGQDVTASPQTLIEGILAETLREGMSDVEKARALHDWICENGAYDYSLNNDDPLSILTGGQGVCDAYTKAYCMLLDAAGLENRRIECSVGGIGHAINAVRLNGKWYLVDCTNDDEGFGHPDGLFCFDSYVFEKNYNGTLTVEADDLACYAPYAAGRMDAALDYMEQEIDAAILAGNTSFTVTLPADAAVGQLPGQALCSMINRRAWPSSTGGYTVECTTKDSATFTIYATSSVTDIPYRYSILNDEVCLRAYLGSDTQVNVPAQVEGKPVTRLEGTFDGNKTLTKVVLPEGLRSIGSMSFHDCSALQEINLVSSLTSIENYAFFGCTLLSQDIRLPEGLEHLGASTFGMCVSLKRVSLPSTLTSIGKEIFSNCSSLSQVTLANGITTLSDGMFLNCISLKQLTLPESLRSIKTGAFTGCSITTLRIPKNVEEIQWGAFVQALHLNQLSVSPENQHFTAQDKILYSRDMKRLLMVTDCAASHCVIPDGVETICSNAFSLNTSIIDVYVPSSVRTIEDYALFGTGIERIEIAEGVESIGAYAFAGYGTISNVYFGKWFGASSLLSISLPETLTHLGEGALYGCCVERLCLPASLKTLSAPIVNTGLHLYIPEGITSMALQTEASGLTVHGAAGTYAQTYAQEGGYTFVSESSQIALDQTELYLFPMETVQLNVLTVGGEAFTGTLNQLQWESSNPCVNVENGLLRAASTGYAKIIVSDGNAVGTCSVYVYSLPESDLYSIGYIGNDGTNLTRVGQRLFFHLSIASLGIPQEDGSIQYEYKEFRTCDIWSVSDTKVFSINQKGEVNVVGPGVASVYATLPDGCRFSMELTALGKAFDDESRVLEELQAVEKKLLLPDGLKDIEEEAFSGARFEAVILPQGCRAIGSLAFADNPCLRFVVIPDSVTEIAQDAFLGSDQVTLIVHSGYASRFAERQDIAYYLD